MIGCFVYPYQKKVILDMALHAPFINAMEFMGAVL